MIDQHTYLKPGESHRIGETEVFAGAHTDTTGRTLISLAWETPPPTNERLRRRMVLATTACWVVVAVNVAWIAARFLG